MIYLSIIIIIVEGSVRDIVHAIVKHYLHNLDIQLRREMEWKKAEKEDPYRKALLQISKQLNYPRLNNTDTDEFPLPILHLSPQKRDLERDIPMEQKPYHWLRYQ